MVGVHEGFMVGGELRDEAVEDVREVGVGALDFVLDGLGDGAAAGDGGARAADGGAVGGDGALQVGKHGGGESVFGQLRGVGGDERGGCVIDALRGVVEQGVAGVLQSACGHVELRGEGFVLRFKGIDARRPGDDDGAVDDGGLEPVLVEGDAGEGGALRFGKRGENVDAAGEAGLSAHECGEDAPDGLVGGGGEDEVGGLVGVGFVDLVVVHFFGMLRVEG